MKSFIMTISSEASGENIIHMMNFPLKGDRPPYGIYKEKH